MTENQQKIIHLLSEEISTALSSCEHSRNCQGQDVDKIDAYIQSYTIRVNLLQDSRGKLENEFTTMHYDPR
jgi:hypothetical protein